MNNRLITAQVTPPAWSGTVLFLNRGESMSLYAHRVQSLLGNTQPDVITSRKDPLCGFSRFSRLLAKLVDGDDVCYHNIEATGEYQGEGGDTNEPYEVQTEEQDWIRRQCLSAGNSKVCTDFATDKCGASGGYLRTAGSGRMWERVRQAISFAYKHLIARSVQVTFERTSGR